MLETVVIVCEAASVQGGAEKVAIDSALELARQGLKITFFAASGPIDPRLANNSNIRVELVRDSYSVDALPQRERVFRATYDRVSQSRFASLLASHDPRTTVVHLHAWRFALTSSILQPLFESHFPVVYTLHEFGIGCPYVGFYDYRREAVCPQKGTSLGCLLTNCNRTSYAHKLWIFAKNGIIPNYLGQRSRLRHCVFVSEFSRTILKEYLAPDAFQRVVPNPIEVEDQGPRPLPANAPFLFVGRMTLEKDPVTFALAARSAGAPAVFVGDGPLREAVAAANPEAKLTGWLSNEEVIAQMRRARALVFPSVWYETLGLSVWEAAANGVPAIVSNVSAPSREIDEQIGRVFQAGSVDELARRLRELDDETAVALGNDAYRRYWQNPNTLERHAREIREVYEIALKDRPQ